jgi:ABC-type glycerol-3-phosphate transport system substrate-binding protein
MTRPPLILAAVAVALALGACGSSNDPNGAANGASRQDKAFEGALKFSQCMRQHGIDMPDPQRVGKGGIKLSGGKVNFNDPKMKSAQSACQKYMQIGGGETIDPAKRAKLQEAALNYARCMRGQGVDMPDPKLAGNGGLTFQAGPGSSGPKSSNSTGPSGGLGVNPDSPKFKAADKECSHFLGDRPGAGPSTETAK